MAAEAQPDEPADRPGYSNRVWFVSLCVVLLALLAAWQFYLSPRIEKVENVSCLDDAGCREQLRRLAEEASSEGSTIIIRTKGDKPAGESKEGGSDGRSEPTSTGSDPASPGPAPSDTGVTSGSSDQGGSSPPPDTTPPDGGSSGSGGSSGGSGGSGGGGGNTPPDTTTPPDDGTPPGAGQAPSLGDQLGGLVDGVTGTVNCTLQQITAGTCPKP